MPDALDRAAQAAWEANGYAKYSDADWPDLPSYVREHWRGVAVAALTVMADDLLAEHRKETCGMDHNCDQAWCLDRYVGSDDD